MGSPERHVNTVEAKNKFNELVAEVNRTGKPIIVEKHREPVAVVLDYKSFLKKAPSKREKKGSSENLLSELQAFHRMMKKRHPEGTGDSVEILRQMREERSGR